MFTSTAQSVSQNSSRNEEEGTVPKMSCQRFDFNFTGAAEKIPFDMTEPEKNIHLAFYFIFLSVAQSGTKHTKVALAQEHYFF